MSKITNVGGLLYSPTFYYKEGINYVRYYFNDYIDNFYDFIRSNNNTNNYWWKYG